MTYILVIWTVVAAAYQHSDSYAWRPIGEFKTQAACERAGELVSYDRKFRCLPTK